ncbi:hypothetical protein DRQ07_11860 [candidate division KSB1 bacterium]|nr:MAG: hypothetical protein DRQ07_11860 [candidate division KSB1 bacterium]
MEIKKNTAGNIYAIIGSLMIIVFFFFPWVRVSLPLGQRILSGLDLADKDLRILIIPGLAFVIFSLSILNIFKPISFIRILNLCAGILGFVVTISTYTSLNTELNKFFIRIITNYHIELWFYLIFFGFLLSTVSSVFISGRNKISKSGGQTNMEYNEKNAN